MSLEVDIRKSLSSFELDVQLSAGSETLGLLGASGCGKSMTLRCIAGVETPDEGRIVVNGRVFFDSEAGVDLSPQERKTALLFQNYQLFPNMTVEQNVAAGMDPGLGKVERSELVARYLALFSLQGFEKRYPMRLSGGQQQRVALARMLAARPGILMLDEPFSALDTHLKESLQQALLELFDSYEGTILYVSHDIDEAFRFCDRIAVVEEGHVVELAPTEKIVEDPGTLATVKISGCKNISRAEKVAPHVVEALDWGLRFELGPGREVPDGLGYIGLRESCMRPAAAGEEGANVHELVVRSVSDSRFERTAVLEAPKGEGHVIYWDIDKELYIGRELPEAGQTVRVGFDADRLYMVGAR